MFRISIRDVLWLTVVGAVLVAWWIDHRELIRQREAGMAMLMRWTPKLP